MLSVLRGPVLRRNIVNVSLRLNCARAAQASSASESNAELPAESFASRYSRDSILRSEFIYGRGFQGPGGIRSTQKYAATLGLQPGMTIVDAGCGPGGATFHFAKACGVHAIGIDIQPEMVQLCQERAEEEITSSVQGNAQFKLGSLADVSLVDKSSVDCVWSRDALIYLPDKGACLDIWFSWLKPGGQVFITDYGISKNPTSQYLSYVEATNQSPELLEDLADCVSQAGFKDVKAVDISREFLELYEADLAAFVSKKCEFMEAWGAEHYEQLHQRWVVKIESIKSGSMIWNMVQGKKPE